MIGGWTEVCFIGFIVIAPGLLQISLRMQKWSVLLGMESGQQATIKCTKKLSDWHIIFQSAWMKRKSVECEGSQETVRWADAERGMQIDVLVQKTYLDIHLYHLDNIP